MYERRIVSELFRILKEEGFKPISFSHTPPSVEFGNEEKEIFVRVFIERSAKSDNFYKFCYASRDEAIQEFYTYDRDENLLSENIFPIFIVYGKDSNKIAERIFKRITKRVSESLPYPLSFGRFLQNVLKNLGTEEEGEVIEKEVDGVKVTVRGKVDPVVASGIVLEAFAVKRRKGKMDVFAFLSNGYTPHFLSIEGKGDAKGLLEKILKVKIGEGRK